jgi:hypothetical protein
MPAIDIPVVFVCTYTGAKHVEFLAHKNHPSTRTAAWSLN